MTDNIARLRNYVDRLKKEPYLLLPSIFAYTKGWYYKFKFRLLLKNFAAGKYFRVYGSLKLSGPGKVIIGDDCLIISDAIKPVCIRVLSPNAMLEMGNSVGLNGTSIQCVNHIKIGDFSNIADAYMTDSSAHLITSDRRSSNISDAKNEKVTIGNNVWISVNVTILQGVSIGDNTVIGACTLVRKSLPEGVFAVGNPIKIIKKIDE